MTKPNFHTILFDLGGVILELTGVQTICDWFGNTYTEKELWEKWLTSPAVRSFESGKISPETFSKKLREEMELPINSNDLTNEFKRWLKGIYPGAKELLYELSSYQLACFSNTNELHWPRVQTEFGIYELFDKHYASHHMGMLKPDDDAFQYVINDLDCPPREILFLDDNQMNVDAAVKNGMTAYCVAGVDNTRSILCKLGVL